jgi:hypothetical protein
LFDPSQMGPSGPAPAPPEAEPSVKETIEDLLGRHELEIQQVALEDGTLTAEERLLIDAMATARAKFLAKREKEEQAALGGGPATNFLRRSVGG